MGVIAKLYKGPKGYCFCKENLILNTEDKNVFFLMSSYFQGNPPFNYNNFLCFGKKNAGKMQEKCRKNAGKMQEKGRKKFLMWKTTI